MGENNSPFFIFVLSIHINLPIHLVLDERR